jgi:hypothetical protein
MSDLPATALCTLAVLAALSGRPFTAGAVSGVAVLVRPSLLPVAAAVALVLTAWSDRPPVSRREFGARLVRFAAAMTPGAILLAWIQWSLYGHPLASGHGTFADLFSAANIVPNIRDYAMRVMTGETPALALIAACVVVILVVPQRSPVGQDSPAGLQSKTCATESKTGPTAAEATATILPSIRIAALVAAPVLACYLAYGVFPDWAYLRFLLPLWPAAIAAAGAVVAASALRLPAAARTQILLVALTAVGARNVMTAAHEGAFTLSIDAARYRTAARYLDAALPSDTVVVTSQHSGSVNYYTSRPVLRWDLLNIGLDEALAELARLGRPAVILVEDWEEALLRQKFPASAAARLDWPARADFGNPTHVRLYDPADRGRSTTRPPDRVP